MASTKERYVQAVAYYKAGKLKKAQAEIKGVNHPKVNALRQRIEADLKATADVPVYVRIPAAVGVILVSIVLAGWVSEQVQSFNSADDTSLAVQVGVVFFGTLFILGYVVRMVLKRIF